MTKSKHDNIVTNRTNMVYDENKTKFPYQIRPSAVCDENQTGQRRDQSIGLVYAKIETELSGPI